VRIPDYKLGLDSIPDADVSVADKPALVLSNKTEFGVVCSSNRKAKVLGGPMKRLLDLLITVPAVLILLPLVIGIWGLVRVESKGPGLFRQKRGGLHGKSFEIFKFRTMRLHDGKFVQASRQDDRITPVGAFLRRSSLDELPQLFNVLKGDMSLVGPRPHVLDHDAQFMKVDERYAWRFVARPGLTGWAQVSGSRGPTETDEKKQKRIDLDLDYIKNWSHVKDLIVVLKTFLLILTDKNAF